MKMETFALFNFEKNKYQKIFSEINDKNVI